MNIQLKIAIRSIIILVIFIIAGYSFVVLAETTTQGVVRGSTYFSGTWYGKTEFTHGSDYYLRAHIRLWAGLVKKADDMKQCYYCSQTPLANGTTVWGAKITQHYGVPTDLPSQLFYTSDTGYASNANCWNGLVHC